MATVGKVDPYERLLQEIEPLVQTLDGMLEGLDAESKQKLQMNLEYLRAALDEVKNYRDSSTKGMWGKSLEKASDPGALVRAAEPLMYQAMEVPNDAPGPVPPNLAATTANINIGQDVHAAFVEPVDAHALAITQGRPVEMAIPADGPALAEAVAETAAELETPGMEVTGEIIGEAAGGGTRIRFVPHPRPIAPPPLPEEGPDQDLAMEDRDNADL